MRHWKTKLAALALLMGAIAVGTTTAAEKFTKDTNKSIQRPEGQKYIFPSRNIFLVRASLERSAKKLAREEEYQKWKNAV